MSPFRSSFLILLASLTGLAFALTAQECAGKFAALRFSFGDFERYAEFFDEKSTMTQANTGVYRGPADIEEYGKLVLRFESLDVY